MTKPNMLSSIRNSTLAARTNDMLICILRISEIETVRPFPECWKLQIFWQMLMFGHSFMKRK